MKRIIYCTMLLGNLMYCSGDLYCIQNDRQMDEPQAKRCKVVNGRLHALAEQYAAKATSNNKLLTIADKFLTVANKFIKSITNENIKGSLSEKQIEI